MVFELSLTKNFGFLYSIQSNSIVFLWPVFVYALCNPVQTAYAEKIWSVFLKQQKSNSPNFQSLLQEIFAWCRVSHTLSTKDLNANRIVFWTDNSRKMSRLINPIQRRHRSLFGKQQQRTGSRESNDFNRYASFIAWIWLWSKERTPDHQTGDSTKYRAVNKRRSLWLYISHNVTDHTFDCAILLEPCTWCSHGKIYFKID